MKTVWGRLGEVRLEIEISHLDTDIGEASGVIKFVLPDHLKSRVENIDKQVLPFECSRTKGIQLMVDDKWSEHKIHWLQPVILALAEEVRIAMKSVGIYCSMRVVA